MGYDSDLFMDIEFEVMDQDQTKIELWIVIFRVYKGIIGFYLLAKQHFLHLFACFFLVITVQFLAGFVCYFLCGLAMGRSSGYCVKLSLGRALWGLCHLQGRGVTTEIWYDDDNFKSKC